MSYNYYNMYIVAYIHWEQDYTIKCYLIDQFMLYKRNVFIFVIFRYLPLF